MVFIAWTIYAYPKLQAHPSQFIGLFSISLAILMWMSIGHYAICPGPAEVIFAQTVYFDTSEESLFRAMNTLTYSFMTIYSFLATFPVLVELCLCFEMV
jgi:hypothetical protein